MTNRHPSPADAACAATRAAGAEAPAVSRGVATAPTSPGVAASRKSADTRLPSGVQPLGQKDTRTATIGNATQAGRGEVASTASPNSLPAADTASPKPALKKQGKGHSTDASHPLRADDPQDVHRLPVRGSVAGNSRHSAALRGLPVQPESRPPLEGGGAEGMASRSDTPRGTPGSLLRPGVPSPAAAPASGGASVTGGTIITVTAGGLVSAEPSVLVERRIRAAVAAALGTLPAQPVVSRPNSGCFTVERRDILRRLANARDRQDFHSLGYEQDMVALRYARRNRLPYRNCTCDPDGEQAGWYDGERSVAFGGSVARLEALAIRLAIAMVYERFAWTTDIVKAERLARAILRLVEAFNLREARD